MGFQAFHGFTRISARGFQDSAEFLNPGTQKDDLAAVHTNFFDGISDGTKENCSIKSMPMYPSPQPIRIVSEIL